MVLHLADLIARHGVLAVFVLMALDAVLPAGGEVTMLLAGVLAAGALRGGQPLLFGTTLAQGAQTYVVLALAGTVGYVAGALAGWAVGRRAGRALLERHGRRLHLAPDHVVRAERRLARGGTRALLLGRLTPVIRSVMSIPAGVLGSPLGPYAAMTLLGAAVWCFAVGGAGWVVGSGYTRVENAFRYADVLAVVAVVVAAGAVAMTRRVAGGRRRRRRGGAREPRHASSPPIA